MTRSIHDNFIVAYSVDGERGSIVLRTEFRDTRPVERTRVVFEGVEGYRLDGDIPGQNILFSIDELDAEAFLVDHADEFDRAHGWPGFWTGSVDDAREYLASAGARGFVITVSSGLAGWGPGA